MRRLLYKLGLAPIKEVRDLRISLSEMTMERNEAEAKLEEMLTNVRRVTATLQESDRVSEEFMKLRRCAADLHYLTRRIEDA